MDDFAFSVNADPDNKPYVTPQLMKKKWLDGILKQNEEPQPMPPEDPKRNYKNPSVPGQIIRKI